jgi:hypothetical protein
MTSQCTVTTPDGLRRETKVFLQKTAEFSAQGRYSSRLAVSLSGELAVALGCPTGEQHHKSVTIPVQVPFARTQDVQICLATLLRCALQEQDSMLWPVMQLLVAIDRNRVLPYFRKDPRRALDLASCVLLYIDWYHDKDPMDVAAEPFVCHLLNEWLQPETAWTELPDSDKLAESFFGQAWPMFANTGESLVGLVAQRDKPPFVGGLLNLAGADMLADLPDLGMTS